MAIVRQIREEKIAIIEPQQSKEDSSLRPSKIKEYIGQNQIKRNLAVSIQAANKKKKNLEHILIYGAPGLGKTTLANIIAYEMNTNIKTTSGPALEKAGDLASILTNLKKNDILFIDEIHRLRAPVEEILYSAMEDFKIDIVLGKGPGARTMRLDVPKFTLIGATTKLSMLSSPLRDRFGHIFKLNFYDETEIQTIIKRSAKILKCEIEDEAASLLAQCSRQTPRIANRLLRRSHDFALVQDEPRISLKRVKECLSALHIDPIGLSKTDHFILATIIEKFRGGPVGLNTIAAATSEDESTIEDAYEPYLIQLGFLERTPRGRVATENAYQHLGLFKSKT